MYLHVVETYMFKYLVIQNHFYVRKISCAGNCMRNQACVDAVQFVFGQFILTHMHKQVYVCVIKNMNA
jgi:hypothetical protein